LAEAGAGLTPTRPRRVRLGWLDAALLLLLAAGAWLIAWRMESVLHYRWNWAAMPNWILRWDAERGWVANLLLQGLMNTLRLSLWGMLLASLFGIAVGLARTAIALLPRLLAGTYVEVMRNTPPLVLVFVGYFFISSQVMPLLGIDAAVRGASPGALALLSFAFGDPRLLQNFLSAVLVLALFEGAYIAEILRAGIQSIPRGQWDAAAALGMRRRVLLRTVILPQAVARMVPPFCGQFVSLIKDSSIVSLISIQDLTFMANDIAVSTGRVFETWLTASGFYLVLCLALSLAFRRLERRVALRV
jgi:polar amino acid transport system permease protein